MQETGNWLKDYDDSHRDVQFVAVYRFATLTLVLSTVGMLWALPVPQAFAEISPVLNWGSAFLMAATVYYFIISMPLAVGMLPIVFGFALLQIWLAERTSWSPTQFSAGLFLISLLGLYLGNASNGGIRAVVRDIQLMMIAPLWALSRMYKRIGIPYE